MSTPPEPDEKYGLSHRVLVVWYRLMGATPVQAEWRARQRANAAPSGPSTRFSDPRFFCVCGQMMVKGDTVCPSCERRQYLPAALRTLGRSIDASLPHNAASTLVLVLIILGYAAQNRIGGGNFLGSISPWHFFELGASTPALTLQDQWFRGLTYVYLHGGLLHLLSNLMALGQVGPMIEGYFGRARFLLGWFVSGAAGVMLPPLLYNASEAPTVGASGALCGLLGMAWIGARSAQTTQGRMVKKLVERWMVITTVFGLMMEFGTGIGVAHGAHFGGFFGGIVLGWVFPTPNGPPPHRSASERRATPFIGLTVAVIMIFGFGAFAKWRMDGAPIPESARRSNIIRAWSIWREHPELFEKERR